jgi:energy-coupling factor transporter ATP-binding protein EcfA2
VRITACTLHELACFQHLRLEFPEGKDPTRADTYIFVGTNGTGKSTILRSMAQFFAPEDLGFVERVRSPSAYATLCGTDRDELVMVPRSVTPPVDRIPRPDARVAARTGPVDLYTLFPEVYGNAVLTWLQLRDLYLKARTNASTSAFDWNAFAFAVTRELPAVSLTAIAEATDSPLQGALWFDRHRDPNQLPQWIARTLSKVAFARSKGDLARAEQHAQALHRLERALSGLTESSFEFLFDEEAFAVTARMGGAAVRLHLLPDGVKSIIAWLADLIMRLERIPWTGSLALFDRHFALFLDEIEIHLHPAWQRRLLPVVQELFPNAQLFVSTHSPFVIASARDAWIYPLEFEGRDVVCRGPVEARPGWSYAAVLREILGVDEEFDVDTEHELEGFYRLRDEALRGALSLEALEAEAARLAPLGAEVSSIVGSELAQVRRALQHGKRA